MKALTIWQPWATLIAEGVKPYEFRSWRPPARLIGQRIAIHAGARPVRLKELDELIARMEGGERWAVALAPEALPILKAARERPVRLWRSAILATAILGEPIRGDEAAARIGGPAANDGDRDGHFNWGWPLTKIHRAEPPIADVAGAQGFWDWTPHAFTEAAAESGLEPGQGALL